MKALYEWFTALRQGQEIEIDRDTAVAFLKALVWKPAIANAIMDMKPIEPWTGPPYPTRPLVILDGKWLRIIGTPPVMRFRVDANQVTSLDDRHADYEVGDKHFEWGGYDRRLHHVRLGTMERTQLRSGRILYRLTTHPADLERIARHKARLAEEANQGN